MKYTKLWFAFVLIWLGLASPALAAKIGYYFGTFDPPHRGHLAVVAAAQKELGLDTVYILPNYEPSHKPGASSFEHRYQMVQLIAMRQPEIKLLPTADFKLAYETNPADYIGLLIQALQNKEGPDNQYFHLTGVDSFNKMVGYGKLPLPEENRIVAVLPREGYQVKRVPEVIEAQKQGQVRFLTSQIQGMSSSFLRESVRKGDWQNVDGNISDYILAYILREGLFGRSAYQMDLHTLPNPAGYLTGNLRSVSIHPVKNEKPLHSDFKAYPLQDFIDLESSSEPLTLDSDKYLSDKIPQPIYELLTNTKTRIKLVGGITESPESRRNLEQWLEQSSVHDFEVVDYWRPDRERVGLHYWLAYEHINQNERIPYLVISNFFGEDRLYHILLQHVRLLQGAGRSLEDLKLYLPDHFDKLETGLCQVALKDLRAEENSTVFIGYHGALNFVLSDLQQYQSQRGTQALTSLNLEQLDTFIQQTSRDLKHPDAQGLPYFPYWTYSLEGLQGSHQIVSFRNTYGVATETLLKTLINKGFRTFVLFGNGGGLSPSVTLNQIYAPGTFSYQGKQYLLHNRALADYPEASIIKVRSILDESQSWLRNNQQYDLVDVENVDAARTLYGLKNLYFYSGVLVSDRPGEQDITHKNEDSKDLIQLKRSFFFKVLQKIIWQEQGLMSHGSNTLVMPCANSECETPEYIWQRAS